MEKNGYSNAKIYKLQCNDGHYYIGSTINTLSKRLYNHKSDCLKKPSKIHKHINDIGWNNVKIVLISEHCLENKEQLLREEDKCIRECMNDPFCLNCRGAIIDLIYRKESHKKTNKNWYEKNKDTISKQHKEYYEKNKDTILNKQKEYNEKNKDTILNKQKEYTLSHKQDKKLYDEKYYMDNSEKIKQYQKKYSEQNKDKIKERNKEYRERNKDKIKENKARTYTCECGITLTIAHKNRHEKSKKHDRAFLEKYN